MRPRILLLNPPIYDFSAYDFWLKPYGMLRVAGFLRGQADFALFDFLDRLDRRVPPVKYRGDRWGRGSFYSVPVEKPSALAAVPRQFHRFGLPRAELESFLRAQRPFDYALVQTGMTYWYLGLSEVIETLRRLAPETKIILGGVYATICPDHARALGADLVVAGSDLAPLWKFLRLCPDEKKLPLWDLYPQLATGVLKLADGCPFRCTYCSVPQIYPKFHLRPLERSLAELNFLARLGVEHVAFYDDALLYRPEKMLGPFLREILRRDMRIQFHTPNAMNARFIDKELACLLIAAGFKNIYLGFESSALSGRKRPAAKCIPMRWRARWKISCGRAQTRAGFMPISSSATPAAATRPSRILCSSRTAWESRSCFRNSPRFPELPTASNAAAGSTWMSRSGIIRLRSR
jgi:hypothetical protein